MKNKVVFGLVSLIVFISLSSLSALSAEEQQQTTSISALERANLAIDACYEGYIVRYPNWFHITHPNWYGVRYLSSVKTYLIWLWEMNNIRYPFSGILAIHAKSIDDVKEMFAMKNSDLINSGYHKKHHTAEDLENETEILEELWENFKKIGIDFTQLLDLYNDLCSVYLDPDNENKSKIIENFHTNLTSLGTTVYSLKEKIRHDIYGAKSNEKEVPSYWWD